MRKYFNRRALLSSLAFSIGLAAGIGGIADAKAVDYNNLTLKPLTVGELGVPANTTSPVRILPGVRR
jgi:hypothetical protein